jgi:uncharacterized protein DUF1203
MFHHRLLSVRAYDEAAMMTKANVVEGSALEQTIRDFFTTESISYLHIHNAGPGCFNCLVQRNQRKPTQTTKIDLLFEPFQASLPE